MPLFLHYSRTNLFIRPVFGIFHPAHQFLLFTFLIPYAHPSIISDLATLGLYVKKAKKFFPKPVTDKHRSSSQ